MSSPDLQAQRIATPVVRDRLYIGGRWVEPAQPATIEVMNPTDERVIGSVPAGTADDVDRAVAAAVAAFDAWSRQPVDVRAGFILLIAAQLRKQREELASIITAEVGSPIEFSRTQQVGLPIDVAEGMAGELGSFEWEERIGRSLVVREPIGVVGAITPWNYPLHQVIAKVAAALAAGCPVVLKPSELAPFSAFALADLLDEIDLPAGVFNLVSGYGPVVGEAIAAHPDVAMVSLTGSLASGRRVTELGAATAKRIGLELGGKSATVLLDDADLEAVVPQAVMQCFRNSGQNCSALSRLVVPRDWVPRVKQIATWVADTAVVGDPREPSTQLGPLISGAQRERVRAAIRGAVEQGATLVAGGTDAPNGFEHGFFVRPTVLSSVTSDMAIAQEEVFGPVIAILAHDGDDDAVRIANDSRYGLSGAVWSGDPARAERVARRIRSGRVVVNGGPFNPVAPFGGVKQSGTGRELGRYGIEEFLLSKTLQR
jgi:acyl-CoA reductase-like NAD-dependent aldehyde dehydrogenase